MAARRPAEALHLAIQLRLDPQGWLGTAHDRLAAPPLGQTACQLGWQRSRQAAAELPYLYPDGWQDLILMGMLQPEDPARPG